MDFETAITITALVLSFFSVVVSLLVWKEFSAFRKFWFYSVSLLDEPDLIGDEWERDEDIHYENIPTKSSEEDSIIDIQDYLQGRYDPDDY